MRIPANSDQAPAPSQRSETVLEKRDTTIETPAIPVTKEAPPEPARPRRSLKRPLLFAVLPLALIVGGYFYVCLLYTSPRPRDS